ncbi:MAG: phospho-N-acetylmuramoyl-pentapeptide-transferase [Planctomycetaceae bacterium]
MLIWLLHRFVPLLERVEAHASGDSRVFLTARIALASLTSFLAAIILGPIAIRWLKARFRERIASDSARLNEIQSGKNSTPTMGGIFIVGAVLLSAALWGDLGNPYVRLGILAAAGFGILGAIDDWIKLSTPRNGLSVRQKLAGQTVIALVIAFGLWGAQSASPRWTGFGGPFTAAGPVLGLAIVAWSLLVLVASSNAVNLTDGLDGLAGGCMVFSGSAFVALAYLAGHKVMAEYLHIPYLPGVGELAVVLGAMVGAVLGFLWFNCFPAQVFMGDTGALPLGGIVGLAALATRQEALLLIVGGVFVIETASVIAQIAWFRCTRTRLFACSPLHNHFLFRGQHEMKIVVRFWIGAALLAIAGVASLKIR